MHRLVVGAAVLAFGAMGCTFDASTQGARSDGNNGVVPTADADPEAPDGSESDAALPCSEFASAHFDACLLGEPSAPLDLTTVGEYLYNTDDGTLEDPQGLLIAHQSEVLDIGGVSTRVVSVDSMSVAAEVVVRAHGNRPLVIASWSSIELQGAFNLASRRGRRAGAGANPVICDTSGVGSGENDTSGGGGGGGGGFGGQGGNGSIGDGDNTPSAGGSGGMGLAIPPTMVRGGCAGGVGGDGLSGAGEPSAGGGAIQLTAKTKIGISGAISAGGAGGSGGPTDSRAGGGGGGSGGYIGLQAPQIELADTAVLVANGGGGGEGTSSSRTGDSGDDAERSANPAAGGGGNSQHGVDGGEGGAGATSNGENSVGSLASGGGGGGGSVGFVLIWSPSLMADSPVVSPPATSL